MPTLYGLSGITIGCTDQIVRELLTYGCPLFLGVDGEGAAHYWDSYEFAVAVIEGDDAETVELSETPFETRSERG